jgi:hypothetical protein
MKQWFGWIFLGFVLAGVNFVAVMVTWRLATVPHRYLNPWGGPRKILSEVEQFADGRLASIETVRATGVSRRTEIEPWNYIGVASVWWPVVLAPIYTPLVILFVRRDGFRVLFRTIGLRRSNILGWMILIAIFGIEFVLIRQITMTRPEPSVWILEQFTEFLRECGVPLRILKNLLRYRDLTRAASSTVLVLGIQFLVLIPLGLLLSCVRPLPRQTPSVIDQF